MGRLYVNRNAATDKKTKRRTTFRAGLSSQRLVQVMEIRSANFRVGQVVKHRIFPFRGVIYDIDPIFAHTEEWWESIPPEIRPCKDQPFYHLYAENDQVYYEAYVSEQNLVADDSGTPVGHPAIGDTFGAFRGDHYEALATFN